MQCSNLQVGNHNICSSLHSDTIQSLPNECHRPHRSQRHHSGLTVRCCGDTINRSQHSRFRRTSHIASLCQFDTVRDRLLFWGDYKWGNVLSAEDGGIHTRCLHHRRGGSIFCYCHIWQPYPHNPYSLRPFTFYPSRLLDLPPHLLHRSSVRELAQRAASVLE